MPSSTDTILNSIKGRIWLAAGALAAVECFGGLGVYVAMTFLGAESIVSVFVGLFFLAFVTIVAGWWLANDVLRPIDSLTLIAKSLERSPNATLPRTTGSRETDELLGTLHRNGRQIQNLILMMDDVAAGRADSVNASLESTDKLGASFQKLAERVTESITAKQELDDLRENLTAIDSEIAGVRGGKLDLNFRSQHEATAEITETIRFLASRLDKVARGVQVSSAGLGSAAAEARRVLTAVSEACDNRNALTSRGIAAAGELQAKAGTIVRSVDTAIATFGASVAVPQYDEILSSLYRAAELPTRATESSRKLLKLRSAIAELGRVSRSANEIARRTNLVALNTPLYNEGADDGHISLDLIVNEVTALSERAEALSKDVRSIAETLGFEVGDLGGVIQSISAASLEAARGSERAGRLLDDYKLRFEDLAAIRPDLARFSSEQTEDHEKLTQIAAAIAADRSDEQQIREAELQMRNLVALVEGLKDSVSDLQPAGFRTPAGANGNGVAAALKLERHSIAALANPEEN